MYSLILNRYSTFFNSNLQKQTLFIQNSQYFSCIFIETLFIPSLHIYLIVIKLGKKQWLRKNMPASVNQVFFTPLMIP